LRHYYVSQIAVAKKMNIKANALQAILHKTNDMRISTLMKLCSTLNITLVMMDFYTGEKITRLYGDHKDIMNLAKGRTSNET